MKVSEMTNKQLEAEFLQYDDMINTLCCYGTKDLRWFDTICKEIENRGGEILTTKRIEFSEEEKDINTEV